MFQTSVTMTLPKFLLADNTDFPDVVFIVHTDYPRFVLNVQTDHIEWFEDFTNEDPQEIAAELENKITEAFEFYEREISRYEEE